MTLFIVLSLVMLNHLVVMKLLQEHYVQELILMSHALVLGLVMEPEYACVVRMKNHTTHIMRWG